MVELVDAPDSKSGGLRPLGVRVPLPALGFQWFSTFAVAVLDKIRTRKAPNVIYRRIFLPSAAQASRRHFYDPAGIAGPYLMTASREEKYRRVSMFSENNR